MLEYTATRDDDGYLDETNVEVPSAVIPGVAHYITVRQPDAEDPTPHYMPAQLRDELTVEQLTAFAEELRSLPQIAGQVQIRVATAWWKRYDEMNAFAESGALPRPKSISVFGDIPKS